MSTTQLPSPDDRPAADVVIFDGECEFCTRQVQRLRKWDAGGRLAFLSLHDPAIHRYAGNLSHEQLMEQMYVVDRQGRQRGGAAAFRYLSRHLPRLWPLAPLLHIPFSLPVWQWLYRHVARRRYRLRSPTCDNDRCRVHFR
jgi:predicted DCC family thiol-disulfide oxidoreductase YuxK